MLLVNGSVLGAMVDMIHAIVEFLNLFFAGVLAGEELLICYGVRRWQPFWTNSRRSNFDTH
jgi:hypothetical protein